MKYVIAIVLAILQSCSGDDTATTAEKQNDQEKWQLVRMWGQIPNSETTGDDMYWQESYVLHTDSTFIKNRIQNGVTVKAKGTYQFTETTEGIYLLLTHDIKNNLIGNCLGNSLVETMWLTDEDTMISSWQACDGPGLEYQKVN